MLANVEMLTQRAGNGTDPTAGGTPEDNPSRRKLRAGARFANGHVHGTVSRSAGLSPESVLPQTRVRLEGIVDQNLRIIVSGSLAAHPSLELPCDSRSKTGKRGRDICRCSPSAAGSFRGMTGCNVKRTCSRTPHRAAVDHGLGRMRATTCRPHKDRQPVKPDRQTSRSVGYFERRLPRES